MTIPVFNVPLMEMLCKELNQRAKHSKVVHCLPNDLHRFYIILRGTEKIETLFFSFASPFFRFHLTRSTAIPKNPSLHPLSSFLEDATLARADVLQHDRILQLTFLTAQGERRLIAEFFSKHPNYYLIKPDGAILFALHPLSQSHYQPPSPRPSRKETAQWLSHREIEQAYAAMEEQWEFTHEKQSLTRILIKEFKSLEKKVNLLLDELTACEKWEIVRHEGDLIKSNLALIKKGTTHVSLYDWVTQQPYDLTLNPAKTAKEEMLSRYKRARKLQAGKTHLSQQLERTQSKLRKLKDQQQFLQEVKTSEELAAYKKTNQQNFKNLIIPKTSTPSSPIYREYQSHSGVIIWVGKSAKANEQLTFQLANGRDWWLHVRGTPGSHVIIRLGKDEEPDTETLKDAMQLALHYSQARSQGEGEVDFTQRKYVSRLGKGKKGLVQISKHKTAWIRLDPLRLQALKDRKKNV